MWGVSQSFSDCVMDVNSLWHQWPDGLFPDPRRFVWECSEITAFCRSLVSRSWSALVCIIQNVSSHKHSCDCARIVYHGPNHSIFSSVPPANETMEPASRPSLDVPSCEEQHSTEGDICSVRECPNYSWSFNHSEFSLSGICGISHKRQTATRLHASFFSVSYDLFLYIIYYKAGIFMNILAISCL